jgi:hypothetical protein
MAHYLVTAYPDHARLPDLREKLLEGEVEALDPFGPELDQALRRARLDPSTGKATWEEEDHCSPPLATEREALLDDHFDEIQVEEVEPGEGWDEIEALPSLWWDPAEAGERDVQPELDDGRGPSA